MNKLLSLVLFSIIFSADGFGQGRIDGFFKGENNGAAVLGIGFEDTKNYFIGTEKSDLSRSLYYFNLFGAYGISDNLDVNISVPYITSNDNSNFQDVSVFIKYKAFSFGKLHLITAAGISTPLTNYDLGGLNDIGQQATVIETRAMAHYKWTSGWFATLQSGFSFKLEETPNSIPVTIKGGKAAGNWYYDLYYDFQHSFGGIDYRGTPRPQNFSEFGVDYHKVGVTVYRSISDSLGGYASLSYLLSGRNVFQGAGYGLGLVYNFKVN